MRIPSNKVQDIAQYFRNELSALYDKEEIERFIQYCFEDFVGYSRNVLLFEPEKTVNESDLLKFHFAVKDLKRGRPIQYILGKASFYGMDFLVSPAVLIPRPETEELAGLVIAESSRHTESFSIIDIGTGSGCIAITLKKKISRAHVYAVDISAEALDIARRNAEQLNCEVKFLQLNIPDPESWKNLPSCSVIVSNPPYIKESEKETMHVNVTDHEPHLALFVPENDPLVFYRAIAEAGRLKLKAGGKLFVEINEALGLDVCILFQKTGYSDVQLRQDLQGKDRFVVASR